MTPEDRKNVLLRLYKEVKSRQTGKEEISAAFKAIAGIFGVGTNRACHSDLR